MSLGRVLLGAGALLMVTGAVVLAFERLGVRPGRLPGDMSWQGSGWRVSFPLATSLLLSLLLTVLLWVAERLRR
jgi:uncharacterized membrane-anchored protein